MPSLAPVIERVSAAVVGVNTHHRSGSEPQHWQGESASESLGVSSGTGFIFHEEGLILTAHHLVAQPMTIAVDVPGHGRMDAELIGEDPSTDLAVIRLVLPPDDLEVLNLGNSDLVRQGDWVMTIGNPLEFDQTVGVGIVSHIKRHLQQDGLQLTNDYLQFTAPANPGSSGSPVFNMDGEVIAITARSARSGEGLSFAVPAKVIRMVLASMEANEGRVRRGYMGMEFVPADRSLARQLSIFDGQGVRVTGIVAGQAAERAGLLAGDILLSFNGRPITSEFDLYEWITWSTPETDVRLEVIRDGVRIEAIDVNLGEVGVATSQEEAETSLSR
ncbi:MAG: S1C family serine protease [Planctomycetota bacterium]|jgi:serine protease Do